MKKYLLVMSLFIASCSSEGAFKKVCYELIDDPDGTTLILEEIDSVPTLTITDPVGGEPVVGIGEIVDGVFVLYDGTKLHFNDEKAWYEGAELVDGLEAKAVDCPDEIYRK